MVKKNRVKGKTAPANISDLEKPKAACAKSGPEVHGDDVVKGLKNEQEVSTTAAGETLKPLVKLKSFDSMPWPPIPWGSLPSLPSFLSFTQDIKLQMCSFYTFVPSFFPDDVFISKTTDLIAVCFICKIILT